ncbi:AmmeMemoRadiSam system protein A [Chloroflexota bacterium]
MAEESLSGQFADRLTNEERNTLLELARGALEEGVRGQPLSPMDLNTLSSRLIEPGATFVTLTINHELRGCIGALEATLALAEDVRVHAVGAALDDYRFPAVREEELSIIKIEISRLTPPKLLNFDNPGKLIEQIRPGVDGVVLQQGDRRATFLPQVWEKVPEVEVFLSMLCRKMGVPSDHWRSTKLQVFTYQVEEFQE